MLASLPLGGPGTQDDPIDKGKGDLVQVVVGSALVGSTDPSSAHRGPFGRRYMPRIATVRPEDRE